MSGLQREINNSQHLFSEEDELYQKNNRYLRGERQGHAGPGRGVPRGVGEVRASSRSQKVTVLCDLHSVIHLCYLHRCWQRGQTVARRASWQMLPPRPARQDIRTSHQTRDCRLARPPVGREGYRREFIFARKEERRDAALINKWAQREKLIFPHLCRDAAEDVTPARRQREK